MDKGGQRKGKQRRAFEGEAFEGKEGNERRGKKRMGADKSGNSPSFLLCMGAKRRRGRKSWFCGAAGRMAGK